MKLQTATALLYLFSTNALQGTEAQNNGNNGNRNGGRGNGRGNGNSKRDEQLIPGGPNGDSRAIDEENPTPGGQRVRIEDVSSLVPGRFLNLEFPSEFRTISGMNTGGQLTFGAALQGLERGPEGALYADGIVEIQTRTASGAERPNARVVSNALDQAQSIPNTAGLSDWFWQWGQWVDHDYSEVATDTTDISVAVPVEDTANVQRPLPMTRSHLSSEIGEDGVRTQENELTGAMDGGNVYGHSDTRLGLSGVNHTILDDNALAEDGTGLLRVRQNALGFDMLPNNTAGFTNNGQQGRSLNFLAGDIRVNEQLGLSVIHTLWVREHNFWARTLRQASPDFTGTEVFEMARVIVQAEMQKITYEDWLPILIGDAIPEYTGFRENVSPNVLTIGAGCAFRVGHTFISDVLQRIFDDGSNDPIELARGFNVPQEVDSIGLNPYMRGFASQVCQESDPLLVNALRNGLLPNAAGQGQDLMVRNIQRARDWGIPTLNTIREAFGLDPHPDFSSFLAPYGDILASVYESPDDIDCFPGMMAEQHAEGAQIGDAMIAVIAEQFTNIRDGDRFFYEGYLSGDLLALIQGTTLSQVIERNADTVGSLSLQENAFFAAPARVAKKMIRGQAVSVVA